VLSEIIDDKDGDALRGDALRQFCVDHNLVLTSIADLVRFRRSSEKLVVRMTGDGPAPKMPTRYGDFAAYPFRSLLDDAEHVALVMGPVPVKNPALVRVHSECCTGDVFGSLRCDCGTQLDAALRKIAEEGAGVLVYLRGQEGRGIGLGHKLRAYALQDKGRDTVEANEELGLPVDSREYGIGAQILVDLGVSHLRLMTNSPSKYHGISGFGLEISERVKLPVGQTPQNTEYLKTKKNKMGHWIDGITDEAADLTLSNDAAFDSQIVEETTVQSQ